MELSFRTGESVLVLGGMDEDGFYVGEIGGQRGLVPSNFLQEAPGNGPSNGSSRRGGRDYQNSPRDHQRGGSRDPRRPSHHSPRSRQSPHEGRGGHDQRHNDHNDRYVWQWLVFYGSSYFLLEW